MAGATPRPRSANSGLRRSRRRRARSRSHWHCPAVHHLVAAFHVAAHHMLIVHGAAILARHTLHTTHAGHGSAARHGVIAFHLGGTCGRRRRCRRCDRNCMIMACVILWRGFSRCESRDAEQGGSSSELQNGLHVNLHRNIPARNTLAGLEPLEISEPKANAGNDAAFGRVLAVGAGIVGSLACRAGPVDPDIGGELASDLVTQTKAEFSAR